MKFLYGMMICISSLIVLIIVSSGKHLNDLFDYSVYLEKTSESIKLQGYFAIHIGIPLLLLIFILVLFAILFLKIDRKNTI
ncbi:hypothetical protein [Pseudalkalibacillus berkeleyi]|uniref:Uncharacterized protein n=1 Tax=Pseudalkalibacillus berkeleyi TaxID=1069813 RepID=A0ABS9H0E4_9BACL|nr:hypothetical protein [Pseudalkalibacillus berkeleyi]MCF6138469.1 hypothetical protein [Pseudalkalibacillus berkeleyi]